MKHNGFFYTVIFILFCFLFLLVCVSCDNTVESNIGSVIFSDGNQTGSRGFGDEYDTVHTVDRIYWAFTAVKVDGLHTTGESEKGGDDTDTGENGKTAGGYKLRPVKQGPASGLGVCNEGFAYGSWKFKVYGYKGYDGTAGSFTELLYTSDEVSVQVSSSVTPAEATFVLTETDAYKALTSFLIFRDLYWTVPENMKIYKGSSLNVTVKEGTEVIAKGIGTVSTTADSMSGTVIPVDLIFEKKADGTVKNQFESSTEHVFTFEIKYMKGTSGTDNCDITDTTDVRKFTIPFFVDTVTTVYGSLDDVNVDCGNYVNGNFGYVVATTADSTNNEFADLQSAFDRNNTVTLVRDLDYAGEVVCKSSGTGEVKWVLNVSDNSYVRNMKVTNGRGSGDLVFTVNLSGGTGVNTFYFNLSPGKSMEIKNILVDNSKNVWIDILGTSTVNKVTLNSAGYNFYVSGKLEILGLETVQCDKTRRLGCHVGSGSEIGQIILRSGFLDLGEHVKVTQLTMRNGLSSSYVRWIEGKPSTTVDNIDDLRDGKSQDGTGEKYNMDDGAKTAFCVVSVCCGNGNLRSDGSNGADIKYGIKGMYFNVPANPFTDVSHGGVGNWKFVGFSDSVYMIGVVENYTFGGSLYKPGAKYLVKNDVQSLQCLSARSIGVWNTTGDGGGIFYIHKESSLKGEPNGKITIDGTIYRFFDSSGNMLGDLSSVAAGSVAKGSELAKAKYVLYAPAAPTGSIDNVFVYTGNNHINLGGIARGWGGDPGGETNIGVGDRLNIGMGKVNTAIMVPEGATEKTQARHGIFQEVVTIRLAKVGGWNDWYIGSANEVKLLYSGNWVSVASYTSNDEDASCYYFDGGGTLKTYNKGTSSLAYWHPIRSF